MTEQEIRDTWLRWCHNAGLKEDMATIWEITRVRVKNRSQFPVDETSEDAAPMMLHCGLSYCHELARDSEGQQMEHARWMEALTDYEHATSKAQRSTVDPFTYGSADDAA